MTTVLATTELPNGGVMIDILLSDGTHATLNAPAMPDDVQAWADHIDATLTAANTTEDHTNA